MTNAQALAPVSVQLYSLRDEAAEDFRGVIARLGEVGFVGVETAGFNGLSPEQLRTALDDAGLEVSSAHVGLDKRDAYEASLDAHQALGVQTVVIPALAPASFADLDSVRAAADIINSANERVRARGLTLGYHNHFWEFENVIEGRFALLWLFDLVDPSVVAEIDIYWAKVGGADPAAIVRELGDRAALLHVKDGPADTPKSAMVAVGDGAVDTAAILGAGSSVRWHIIELDRCDTDMFEAVERSYHYLVEAGLSRGRR